MGLKIAAFVALLLAESGQNRLPASGLGLANFDPTVRREDDLFLAVSGRRLAPTTIPADRMTHGSFTALADKTESSRHANIEDVAVDRARQRGTARLIADVHASLLDSGARRRDRMFRDAPPARARLVTAWP